MIEFRDQLLEYIRRERQICDEMIEAHRNLSDDDKVEAGLMIRNAKIDISESDERDQEYRFRFSRNDTKIRLGDSVLLKCERTGEQYKKPSTVLEIAPNYMVLSVSGIELDFNSEWSIEVIEVSMFGTFIQVLSDMQEGDPGCTLIEQLAGERMPTDESELGINENAIKMVKDIEMQLNESQADALYYAVKCPSLRLIQGPPGTGKTFVLSHIAQIMSKVKYETAIIGKTHQSVNNALNYIKKTCPQLNVIKVGQVLRSEGLDKDVLNFSTYRNYLAWRRRVKRTFADVVGMTLQSASVNLCMKNSGFKPIVILVDEASQIPLAEAAVIGASGAGSIIFIGDDRQMPPIFVEGMEDDPLSVSVFEYLAKKYPEIKDVLNVTHRLNGEICDFVNTRFYKPFNIQLVSADNARDRRMVFDCSDCSDDQMNYIFGKDAPSIVRLIGSDPNEGVLWQDENHDEALFAAQIAVTAMDYGVESKDIAIVTPFRKQVNAIRSAFKCLRTPEDIIPLVDTVERLQGQSVRLIILSLAVTDPNYYSQVKPFLLNDNRLNVMVSRAKEKVVILKSSFINF